MNLWRSFRMLSTLSQDRFIADLRTPARPPRENGNSNSSARTLADFVSDPSIDPLSGLCYLCYISRPPPPTSIFSVVSPFLFCFCLIEQKKFNRVSYRIRSNNFQSTDFHVTCSITIPTKNILYLYFPMKRFFIGFYVSLLYYSIVLVVQKYALNCLNDTRFNLYLNPIKKYVSGIYIYL